MFVAYDMHDGKIWELRENDEKIGFIHITPSGYTVKTNGVKNQFKNLKDLQKKFNKLSFSQPQPNNPGVNSAYGYPCDGEPFNEVWDVANGVPLYTKTAKSKTYFCAGYYVNRELEIFFCPKRMSIERSKFLGPFHSESEARGF